MYNTNEFENQVLEVSCNLYVDILNNSDHHPINIEIIFSHEKELNIMTTESSVTAVINKNLIKIQPNLEDLETKELFMQKVEILIREKSSLSGSTTSTKDKVDEIYLHVVNTRKEAFESLIVYKTKYYHGMLGRA
jgi:hypothetical protein